MIQIQTEALLRNTKERGMLIVKKIETLQKQATKNENASQSFLPPQGLYNTGLYRQEKQLSKSATRQITEKIVERENFSTSI